MFSFQEWIFLQLAEKPVKAEREVSSYTNTARSEARAHILHLLILLLLSIYCVCIFLNLLRIWVVQDNLFFFYNQNL